MAHPNSTRNCAQCGQSMLPHSDFLRAHLWGVVRLFHGGCFIKRIKETGRAALKLA
jgi:hypothetical protein